MLFPSFPFCCSFLLFLLLLLLPFPYLVGGRLSLVSDVDVVPHVSGTFAVCWWWRWRWQTRWQLQQWLAVVIPESHPPPPPRRRVPLTMLPWKSFVVCLSFPFWCQFLVGTNFSAYCRESWFVQRLTCLDAAQIEKDNAMSLQGQIWQDRAKSDE